MILRSPTGAFARVLPKSDADPTPVTYTISNQDPPPVVVSFITKAPAGVISGNPPVEVYNRLDFGQLIFTVINGNESVAGSNRRSFESGEIIEFNDDTQSVESSLPTQEIVVQHNNNVLDLQDLGLTDEEIAAVGEQSTIKLNEIKLEISALQSDISNIRIQIRENQKAINESRKAIKAVAAVYDIGADGTNGNDIYDKLQSKLTQLEVERTTLNESLAIAQSQLQSTHNDLINISQLVK